MAAARSVTCSPAPGVGVERFLPGVHLRIQGRSPAILTCVVQLAGRGQPSYLPTARAVEGGGYSAIIQSNWVGPEGGRLLVDGSVALLEELWSAPARRPIGRTTADIRQPSRRPGPAAER